MSLFSAKRKKKKQQTSSDCAVSLLCCKYGVLVYLKHSIGLSKFLLTVFSENCNTPPIAFLFTCFRSPRFLWTYVNEGSVCFHWSKYSHLLTLVASLTEFHYYFGNSCMKTQQPNLSPFEPRGWFPCNTAQCLYTEVHFCYKTKLDLLPFGKLVTKSGHSGVMAGTLVLEFQQWSWKTGF